MTVSTSSVGEARAPRAGPGWEPDDIPGLHAVLTRARKTGRFVLLVALAGVEILQTSDPEVREARVQHCKDAWSEVGAAISAARTQR